jgi:hypothetical protein
MIMYFPTKSKSTPYKHIYANALLAQLHIFPNVALDILYLQERRGERRQHKINNNYNGEQRTSFII